MRNGMDFNFEVSINFGESEMIIGVEVRGYSFGEPARITGRPETSYPAEGSDFDFVDVCLITEKHYREDGKNRVKEIYSPLPAEMYDVIVEAFGGEDKWLEKIDEEAEERDAAARDEYYDRKYQEMRDENGI